MEPVTVTLSLSETHAAISVGALRQIEAIRQARPDRHGAKAEDGWSLHIEGAAGEMAAAKALGRYWDMPVNTYKQGGDVGDLQVRTRSRHDYELIVRDGDRDGDTFILVTGRIPRFQVHGYIRGRDAKRPEWARNHGGRASAYFVPQAALTHISAALATPTLEMAA